MGGAAENGSFVLPGFFWSSSD